MPKEAMGHNLVILKPDTDKATFAMAGITNKETYLPSDDENKAKIEAATAILGPGEEEVITFTAGEPGEYQAGLMEYTWLNTISFEVWNGIGVGIGAGLRSADFEAIDQTQTYYNLGLSYGF